MVKFYDDTLHPSHIPPEFIIPVGATIYAVYEEPDSPEDLFAIPRVSKKSDVIYNRQNAYQLIRPFACGKSSMTSFYRFEQCFTDELDSVAPVYVLARNGDWTYTAGIKEEACVCVGLMFDAGAADVMDSHLKVHEVRLGKVVARRVPVQSSRDPKKIYEVLVYEDGSKSCNCQSWKYQGGHTRGCKHTRKVT